MFAKFCFVLVLFCLIFVGCAVKSPKPDLLEFYDAPICDDCQWLFLTSMPPKYQVYVPCERHSGEVSLYEVDYIFGLRLHSWLLCP